MKKRDCSQLGFKALMATQFFEALNDNLLKTIASLLIVSQLGQGPDSAAALSLAGAVFVAPFLLFSSYAGFLADRFSKSSITRFVKVFEVFVALLAALCISFKIMSGLYLVLFLMGLHSTIFSPSKYGILPELLDREHLSKGNGYTQFWTFIAILTGTASAGLVMSWADPMMLIPGLALVVIAILGLIAGFLIPKTPAVSPNVPFRINPFVEIFEAFLTIRKDREIFLTLVALSYFWFLGAVFQLNIFLYAREMLHVGELGTTALVTALALGIGIGSIVAGKVSEGKVEMGLVPLGAIGLSLLSILLGFSYFSYALSLLLLFFLGLSGGFFVVPLSAFMQQKSPEDQRGRYLAAGNFFAFTGVLAASFVLWLFKAKLGLTSAQCFWVVGCSTIAATAFIFQTLPEVFVRCVNWLLMHTFYKVTALGLHNVPKSGGALLVCNHASFIDPSLILGLFERPIRFLMYRPIYNLPGVHWFGKTMQAIPVSPSDKPELIAQSLNDAQSRIKNGELVCIFAEGGITRTGNLLPFRKGFERIMDGLDSPIIPVHIDRIWGSIFSFRNGKFLWKMPKRIPYPITITFGHPMPAASKTYEVRQVVQELSSEAFKSRSADNELLQVQFIAEARSHPLRQCVADSSGKSLNYIQTLIQSIALANSLQSIAKNNPMLGLLLPPGVGGVVSNIAALIAGIVPVNLNYSASPEALKSACEQCGIESVITSKAFHGKLALEIPAKLIYLEDLHLTLGLGSRVRAALWALFAPKSWIASKFGWKDQKVQDLATVIFSSGSTGMPKGVKLSHGNISSNVQSLYDIFQVDRKDSVIGVLPFFHSFGFTGTLWFPLLSGLKSVYHVNPLDAAKVGELAAAHRVSILMSTPTFLLSYIRKCEPSQFKNLRYVVVGAEKLKASIAEAFAEKFGIIPLEGYGCTELSPVAILNIPDFEAGKLKQTGQKPGKVGHPIPGVAVKIVDPDSFVSLSPGKEGLLLVKGPNVMLGYLGNPDKTKEVIRDGWYITGDIAKIDNDGFVEITDRLSRFSKIAGEMVPHIRVEEEIHKVLGAAEQVCIVTALPDEKKGERLVVLSTIKLEASEIIAKLGESGLPNLWIPKRDCFFEVAQFPVLGSGKLDLKAIKELAKSLSAKNSS